MHNVKVKNIVDQYSDKGQYILSRILGKEDSGGILKIASSLGDVSSLPSDKFAWSDFRKFPVDSVDNTILSKIYYDNQKENIPMQSRVKIASKLDTYLDLYNVPDEIFSSKEDTNDIVKEAQEATYLLPKYNLCKVASSQDLDKANKVFESEYKKLEINDRVDFACNFMKCADTMKFKGVPSKQIIKYSSMLDSDFKEVKNMLKYRVAAANRIGQEGSEYTKLAEALSEVTEQSSKEELTKLAEVILEIDSKYGFTNPKYDNMMPCAYGVVFNKTAMDSGVSNSDNTSPSDPSKADIVGQYGYGILEEVENDDGSVNMQKLSKIKKNFNLQGVNRNG